MATDEAGVAAMIGPAAAEDGARPATYNRRDASRDDTPSAATSSARKARRRSPAPRSTSTTSRFPNLLHARTIRSTIPAGEIAAIRFNFDTAGFTIVDYRDIPGRNIVALIEDDQPCLAERAIRHVAEPILLLAHEDRETPARGRRPDRLSPSARRSTTPQRRRSCSRRSRIDKGDVEDGFAAADVIVEGEYRIGHQEQLYIEPNGVDRRARKACRTSGGITVYGSMQCPYYVHRALMVLLGLPGDKVRVVQTETGGGFGGKEEYPSMIAGHAALLAHEGRPAGEADLRPRRGHGGDDQAPSGDHPASHRRDARRPAHRRWTSTRCSTAAPTRR